MKTEKEIPLGHHLLTLTVSSHVSRGLAKMSGFDVLYHGTCFPNMIGILKKGGLIQKGGTTSGAFLNEQGELYESAKNRFYVFKDSEAYLEGSTGFKGFCLKHLGLKISPILHAALSGSALVKKNHSLCDKIKILAGAFLGIFTPRMKFFYRKQELHPRFENDPDYYGLAYFTRETIPNNRVSLAGFCFHAKSSDFRLQFKAKPLRAMGGLLQVITGVFLTVVGLGLLT
jgi:hypothetical protein